MPDHPTPSASGAALRAALVEAREDLAEAIAYAPDYFRQKWGLDRGPAKIDEALAEYDRAPSAAPPSGETPSVTREALLKIGSIASHQASLISTSIERFGEAGTTQLGPMSWRYERTVWEDIIEASNAALEGLSALKPSAAQRDAVIRAAQRVVDAREANKRAVLNGNGWDNEMREFEDAFRELIRALAAPSERTPAEREETTDG